MVRERCQGKLSVVVMVFIILKIIMEVKKKDTDCYNYVYGDNRHIVPGYCGTYLMN